MTSESVAKELKDHGIPASCVAHLSGLSQGALSRWLRSTLSISWEAQLKIAETLNALVQLQTKFVLPLDYSQPEKLRSAVEAYRFGHLQPEMESAVTAANEAVAVPE